MEEKLLIRAFRAPDEPETCEEFLREHRRVLEDFGITNVSTNTNAWCMDPNTYVLVAMTTEGRMVGGIRVEIAGNRALPIADALRKLDPRIDKEVNDLASHGTAEVCGLWNANDYSSRGIPNVLSLAAVSIGNQLPIRSMVCLVAHYTLRHALRAGFNMMEAVGEAGTFTYPIPSIKALAMVIPDVRSLDSSPAAVRRNIMSLRLRPDQVRSERPAQVDLELTYSLLLDRSAPTAGPYALIQQAHLEHAP